MYSPVSEDSMVRVPVAVHDGQVDVQYTFGGQTPPNGSNDTTSVEQ